MTRQEMIEVLQKSLLKHMNHMECCSSEEEMYEHILQDLENSGIIPKQDNTPVDYTWYFQ